MLLADELLELLKREKDLGMSSEDLDPYVDAYMKADAVCTPHHIATQVGCTTKLPASCRCHDRRCHDRKCHDRSLYPRKDFAFWLHEKPCHAITYTSLPI